MQFYRKVAFYTLGCKLNFSETSTLSRSFQAAGYAKVDFEDNSIESPIEESIDGIIVRFRNESFIVLFDQFNKIIIKFNRNNKEIKFYDENNSNVLYTLCI